MSRQPAHIHLAEKRKHVENNVREYTIRQCEMQGGEEEEEHL